MTVPLGGSVTPVHFAPSQVMVTTSQTSPSEMVWDVVTITWDGAKCTGVTLPPSGTVTRAPRQFEK